MYVESVITSDAECTADIHAGLNKGIVPSLRKSWKSRDFTTDTKVRLLQTLVWPVATYGCESWNLKRSHEDKLEAFEIKTLRQILRVSWTAKRTNSWVYSWSRHVSTEVYY